MKFIVFYKLHSDVTQYQKDVEANEFHEAIRAIIDEVKDVREISVVEKERKHSKGRGSYEKVD
jgi:hypothetical protein